MIKMIKRYVKIIVLLYSVTVPKPVDQFCEASVREIGGTLVTTIICTFTTKELNNLNCSHYMLTFMDKDRKFNDKFLDCECQPCSDQDLDGQCVRLRYGLVNATEENDGIYRFEVVNGKTMTQSYTLNTDLLRKYHQLKNRPEKPENSSKNRPEKPEIPEKPENSNPIIPALGSICGVFFVLLVIAVIVCIILWKRRNLPKREDCNRNKRLEKTDIGMGTTHSEPTDTEGIDMNRNAPKREDCNRNKRLEETDIGMGTTHSEPTDTEGIDMNRSPEAVSVRDGHVPRARQPEAAQDEDHPLLPGQQDFANDIQQ